MCERACYTYIQAQHMPPGGSSDMSTHRPPAHVSGSRRSLRESNPLNVATLAPRCVPNSKVSASALHEKTKRPSFSQREQGERKASVRVHSLNRSVEWFTGFFVIRVFCKQFQEVMVKGSSSSLFPFYSASLLFFLLAVEQSSSCQCSLQHL